MKETLMSVIQTLYGLFENKAELRGFDDWDRLIGCVVALQNVVNELNIQQGKEDDDGEQDNIAADGSD